jgi:hypothetical protein
MELNHGLHLAYCTNIHRGESWPETLAALQTHTLAVRDVVCPHRPFAIGLRLSRTAAGDLANSATRLEFQRWLDKNDCYIFTINGFPYGQFHGGRVKEAVYQPDWTTPERLAYTNQLFDLLAELVPSGVAGSVSTLPGSFKTFIQEPQQVIAIRNNLWHCVDHISQLSRTSGRTLHLGLEPEPLCFLEYTRETVAFFHELRQDRPQDGRLDEFLGVNYDTCHLAVEYEEPGEALGRLQEAGIKISKIHLRAEDQAHGGGTGSLTELCRRGLSASGDCPTPGWKIILPPGFAGRAGRCSGGNGGGVADTFPCAVACARRRAV